ncbi:MAG: AraC family transcriptional regulator [Azospirillaceae bacterium]|nr:AraC family transcriptional regulator [Azospirillaceae bacterium]
MTLVDELSDLIERHAGGQGLWRTAVPRLSVACATSGMPRSCMTVTPQLCVIARGNKRVSLGDRVFDYGAGDLLMATVSLPASGEVLGASPAQPYLAASLHFDPAVMAGVLLDMPPPSSARTPATGLTIRPLPAEVHDAFLRLVRLLDRPADIPVLAPLVEREILYRLLSGPEGAQLRQIALPDGRMAQVNRAIAWIRTNFAQPFSIAALAQAAGMSPSSLHRHFKAVTTLSPLQYQKQIRLHEARRLLLGQPIDVTAAAFAVGYESATQFNREYGRQFGVPPGRDAQRLRSAPGPVRGSALDETPVAGIL